MDTKYISSPYAVNVSHDGVEACPSPAKASTPVITVMPSFVSEAEYWETYYADPDHHYEWNHGYVEEKGVSDKLTLFSYKWFFELLRNYLRVTHLGEMVTLETGFRLVLPHKTTIRKPDLGVVLKTNLVPWRDSDNSFRGTCDLCVEALSDSSKQEIERDTKTNRYYLLDGVTRFSVSSRGLTTATVPGRDE